MELNSIEITNGIFGCIYVVVSIIVGLRLISKYFKEKNFTYIYVGLTWIGLSTLWLAASLSFLIFLISGKPLAPFLYFFIGVTFIPLILLIWMTAFAMLIYEDYKKIIQIIFTIYGAIFEAIYLYFLFTDITVIGVQKTPIDTDWGLFMTIYLMIIILIGVITGLFFAIKSMKAPNEEIKLRGKFIFVAFLFWALGSALDAIIELPLIRTLAIAMLIISAILWYFAFNLPKFLKGKKI